MPEPDLPTATEPNHPEVAGPPRITLTANPAAGTGRATPLAEPGTPAIAAAEDL